MKIFEKGIVKLLVPDEWLVRYNEKRNLLTINVADLVGVALDVEKMDDCWNWIGHRRFGSAQTMVEYFMIYLSNLTDDKPYIAVLKWKNGESEEVFYTRVGLRRDIFYQLQSHILKINKNAIEYFLSKKHYKEFDAYKYYCIENGSIKTLSQDHYVALALEEVELQQQLDKFYGSL